MLKKPTNEVESDVSEKQKFIAKSTYLKALALFVMGSEASKRAQEFMEEADATLGTDGNCGGSHIGDAIYSNEATVRAFDVALAKEKIKVRK